MDGTTGKPDGAQIWLRYATQFTVGERTHTIEMGVPVPIGASAETRERLFREAEAGMDQLTRHVEHRVASVQQRSTFSSAQNTTPAPKSTVQSVPSPANRVSSSSTPASAGAPLPAASTPTSIREAAEKKEMPVPPAPPVRLYVGASMPSIPGDTSDSLKLPQFIQAIKETLGLTPKQAMDLLNVKTLSGLNLHDALEQLQQITAQGAGGATTTASPGQQFDAADEQEEPQITPIRPGALLASIPGTSSPPQASRQSASSAAPNLKIPGIKEITHAVVREIPPTSAFDEEIDLDLDEDEEMGFFPDLTEQQRAVAEDVLSKLKDARGSSTASETRLKVLHNVINKQVSDDQLLQIIEGVWGVNVLKKLKNDQVEALISWAKAADDFIFEAETVLAVMQEEQYARSDR